MITLTCPQCKNQVSFPKSKVGRSHFVCPRCSFPLEVPDNPDKAATKPTGRPSAKIAPPSGPKKEGGA
jgi:transposase-like protein